MIPQSIILGKARGLDLANNDRSGCLLPFHTRSYFSESLLGYRSALILCVFVCQCLLITSAMHANFPISLRLFSSKRSFSIQNDRRNTRNLAKLKISNKPQLIKNRKLAV